jgi:ABC-type nitrate/sulfonate/bicarbonate transport system permease component
VEELLFPYVIGLQSIPKVAIAPLYVIWFGYQIESKIAMAATLTLFPVLLNALEGFVFSRSPTPPVFSPRSFSLPSPAMY